MEKYLDKKYKLEERKTFYQEHMSKVLNPVKDVDFNPETFDPFRGTPEYEVGKRNRILPPKDLETYNLKPKQIMNGQMIGMFESKQDLYLIFAHRCNALQQEIDNLKKIIEKLSSK